VQSDRIFLFFPNADIGGAARVHVSIVEAVADQGPRVIFTNKPRNGGFAAEFRRYARVWDVSRYGMYSLAGQFLVGLLLGAIDRCHNPTVFGSLSHYYYKMLPLLRDGVRRIDLLHNFGGQFEEISLPCVPMLDGRVVVSEWLRVGLQRQYAAHGLPQRYGERISVIENGVELPATVEAKGYGEALRVLYVGRGSTEKRVHLVGKVAAACRAGGVRADFTLVGDVRKSVAECDRAACRFTGAVSDQQAVARHYADADVLLLTSEREGMPLVVLEAMAHGVVPVCTVVGGIDKHVRHGVSGILVPSGDETRIVAEMTGAVSEMARDRAGLRALSVAARQHALEHCDVGAMRAAYRDVLMAGRVRCRAEQ